MNEILDSGNRTEFPTGAVRDIQEDKGRCDLLPLDIVGDMLDIFRPNYSVVFYMIEDYKKHKNEAALKDALYNFCEIENISLTDMILEVSIHYRDGAEKYGENNWQKGLPIKSYLSSACRHLLKHIGAWKDEPHSRGFVWNMLGALWTIKHKPELIDAPFNNELQNGSETQHSETKCRTMEHIQQRFERVM